MSILGSANYAIAPGWDVSIAATSWYILDGDPTARWYQPEPELDPLPPVAHTGEGDPIYQADAAGRIIHAGKLVWPEPGLPNNVLKYFVDTYPVGGKACIAMLAWGQAAAGSPNLFAYALWNCKIKRIANLQRIAVWQGYGATLDIEWAVKI